MTIDDILFDPIGNFQTAKHQPSFVQSVSSIIRYPGTILAEIQKTAIKLTYTDLAREINSHAVVEMTGLIDVRLPASHKPQGVLDLYSVVSRFYDGIEDMWISDSDSF